MELVKAEQMNAPFQGMVNLPIVRQLALLIGLAVSIALGVSVVLWSQKPEYNLLYNNASGKDAQAMAEVLTRNNIGFRLDPDTGAVMVESGKVHEAKLKLAAENLPGSSGQGFELIDKDQGFGSSAFIQGVRYQRAQEGELARTIMSIAAVSNARVHLAVPKESAFARDKRKPTASVMVKLAAGRRLEKEHVAAITHLVASSVPNLEISQVTVVDDRGRLLSSGDDSHEFGLTTNQFEYTRKLEQTYIDRIERLLSPLVGLNGVRAQVTAELDFTRTESTQETFNPDLPALRSEQNIVEQTQGGQLDSGIPGALSNEPPGQAIAPENATAQGGQAAALAQAKNKSKKRSIRNFELDKTISHTQRGLGGIRHLSVAVVLDVNESIDATGKKSKVPFTDDELTRFTSLVKEAVGFNGLRGDTVNVINLPFQPAEIMAAVPEEPFWEKSWFWSVLKQVAAAGFVIFLILGILRPMMKSLSVPPKKVVYSESGEELSDDQLLLSGKGPRLPKPTTYEDNLNMARSLAKNEPKRVAQVVKGWVEGS